MSSLAKSNSELNQSFDIRSYQVLDCFAKTGESRPFGNMRKSSLLAGRIFINIYLFISIVVFLQELSIVALSLARNLAVSASLLIFHLLSHSPPQVSQSFSTTLDAVTQLDSLSRDSLPPLSTPTLPLQPAQEWPPT